MNFSKESFASPEEILSFVTKLTDDEEYKFISKGWYTSQIQQALQALAFDTFFDERHSSLSIPANLRIKLPSGAFNVSKMYLYNGTVCDIKNSQNVFWKREYFTGGSGYLASDKYNNNDPFFQNRMADGKDRSSGIDRPGEVRTGGNLYFFNIVEGIIMLSPNCAAFQNLYISYNGMGCDYGDKPVIPRFLQQAVNFWVADKALSIRRSKSKDAFELNKWNLIYNSNLVSLNGRSMYDGEWYKAEVRVKSMDNKARKDLKEYLTSLES